MQTLQSAVLIDEDKANTGSHQRGLLPHSMPLPWVKATMVTRCNSCVRGHSAISRSVIDAVLELARHRITPIVPLRGSISASGDLMPLSYVAGAIEGCPDIYVSVGAGTSSTVRSAQAALEEFGIKPRVLGPRDGLGLVNGTAASAAVASLALFDAEQLTLLSACLTSLVAEAMAAKVEWLHPFISEVRPHPGQIEASQIMRTFLQGSDLVSGLGCTADSGGALLERYEGALAQDRYPLRTSPQWLGPQFEDLISAHSQIAIELNSTSDNPVTDSEQGAIYCGGNFQATSITSAVEKIRSSLQMVGKMLFSQCTEMINHQMSNGLPANLAADDPSVSFCLKGLDINMAAYQSELAYLANPMSNHVQSAEMHNQAINSLAFLSTRYTMQAVELVALMVASTLYAACQAVDLRVMHATFLQGIPQIVAEASAGILPKDVETSAFGATVVEASRCMRKSWWDTASLDAHDRCERAASAFVLEFSRPSKSSTVPAPLDISIGQLHCLHARLKENMLTSFNSHRAAFLEKPDSARYLGTGTRRIYTYLRDELGIPMHRGLVDHPTPQAANDKPCRNNGRKTIGSQVSLIYEAVRDGRLFERTMAIMGELGLPCDKSLRGCEDGGE
jgi:phenylalanine ammonia-lyase